MESFETFSKYVDALFFSELMNLEVAQSRVSSRSLFFRAGALSKYLNTVRLLHVRAEHNWLFAAIAGAARNL